MNRFEIWAKKALGVTSHEDPKYRRIRSAYRRTKYRLQLSQITYPESATQEITTRCNSRCKYCARQDMIRNHELKNEDIKPLDFMGIADQLHDVAPDLGTYVFGGLGDPPLHPKLPRFIGYVRRLFPDTMIHLITNGIALTKTLSKKIIAEKPDNITVSINSFSPDTYRKINGVDKFTTVLKNALNLVAARGDKEKPILNMQILDIDCTRETIPEFKRFWSDKLQENDRLIVQVFQNAGGRIDHGDFDSTDSIPRRFPCVQIWRGPMQITLNGDVYPCCIGEIAGNQSPICLGNLFESSLKSLVKGEHLKRIRKIHRREEWSKIPICQVCDLWHKAVNPFFKIRRWL